MRDHVAVLLPSRGLIHSRTVEALDREPLVKMRYYSHGLPIPACYNELVSRFLGGPCSHAWVVEEDVIPPHGALEHMLGEGADVVAVDYPLRSGAAMSARTLVTGFRYVSLGCTLIHRRVFEAMCWPWFRVDRAIWSIHEGSAHQWRLIEREKDTDLYGGHDLYFCYTAAGLGFKIRSVEGMTAEHVGAKKRVA